MTTQRTNLMPSVSTNDAVLGINLNTNTGPWIGKVDGRIPKLGLKALLTNAADKDLSFVTADGYLNINALLKNPPVMNKIYYVLPDKDTELVKSCILPCFVLYISNMVSEHMKLYNIHQQCFILPAKSRDDTIIRNNQKTMKVVHEFQEDNVQSIIHIPGNVNKKIIKILKDVVELPPLTGITDMSDAKLRNQANLFLGNIKQYLCGELSKSEISLRMGVFEKCLGIAKGNSIPLSLARIIHRYYESLWNDKISSTDEQNKRERLSVTVNMLSNQTSAGIFELEHNRGDFLDDFFNEYEQSRVIVPSMVKDGSSFMINGLPVGGSLVMQTTTAALLKSKLSSGHMTGVKPIFFKPDDIFKNQVFEDKIEILYADGINLNKLQSNDIQLDKFLNKDKSREQTGTILKLTETGKKLLETSESFPNNLMGTKKEFQLGNVHFSKNVDYYVHNNKAYPVEVVAFNELGNTDKDNILNTEINYMGVALWGGINPDSSVIKSYPGSLEANPMISQKLYDAHGLFSTKPITVNTPGIDTSTLVFGECEASRVLTNPLRFSRKQNLDMINDTRKRIGCLREEETSFLQSLFKEIDDACNNYRSYYVEYIKSLADNDVCMKTMTLNKLMRIEIKELFSLFKKEDNNTKMYGLSFRYLLGDIPWYVCGDKLHAIRGNRLLCCIQNSETWKKTKANISDIKTFLSQYTKFQLTPDMLFGNETTINACDRMQNAGFNKFLGDDKDGLKSKQWTTINGDFEQFWEKDKFDKLNAAEEEIKKSFLNPLDEIANVFYDCFVSLFQVAQEDQLNYLFVKNDKKTTKWLLICHVILPVLTTAKMKICQLEDTSFVNIDMGSECPFDSIILDNDNDELKTYVLSCNVAKIATQSKYTECHRIASILMLFVYNTPYCIDQMVRRGIHTGFSIAYVKKEQSLAEDIILLQNNAIEMMFSTGMIDATNFFSDYSTNTAFTCEMQYTTNTLGPAGLLAQCVFPKPSILNNSTTKYKTPKLSFDAITQSYATRESMVSDLSFIFSDVNQKIIDQSTSGLWDYSRGPYVPTIYNVHIQDGYVPIVMPTHCLSDKPFYVLGMERCADFSDPSDGYGHSAFHAFFFTDNPSHTTNPYMSNLFSEGTLRYLKNNTPIDKNVPIKTRCLSNDINLGQTTQAIREMVDMKKNNAFHLTQSEQNILKTYDEQYRLQHEEDDKNKEDSPLVQLTSYLPNNSLKSYEHPALRLGCAVQYTQHCCDEIFKTKVQQLKATAGGDLELDGSPFGHIYRSPFTANRDRNIRMVDTPYRQRHIG